MSHTSIKTKRFDPQHRTGAAFGIASATLVTSSPLVGSSSSSTTPSIEVTVHRVVEKEANRKIVSGTGQSSAPAFGTRLSNSIWSPAVSGATNEATKGLTTFLGKALEELAGEESLSATRSRIEAASEAFSKEGVLPDRRTAVELNSAQVLTPNPEYFALIRSEERAIRFLRLACEGESPESHAERLKSLLTPMLNDKDKLLRVLQRQLPILLPDKNVIFFSNKPAVLAPQLDSGSRSYCQITLSFLSERQIHISGKSPALPHLSVQVRCHSKTSPKLQNCPTNSVIDMSYFRNTGDGYVLCNPNHWSLEPRTEGNRAEHSEYGNDAPTTASLSLRRSLKEGMCTYLLTGHLAGTKMVSYSRALKEALVDYKKLCSHEEQAQLQVEAFDSSCEDAGRSAALEGILRLYESPDSKRLPEAPFITELRHIAVQHTAEPNSSTWLEIIGSNRDRISAILLRGRHELAERRAFLASHRLAQYADELLPPIHHASFFELDRENGEWVHEHCRKQLEACVKAHPEFEDIFEKLVKL